FMLETVEHMDRIGRSQAAASLALATISVESAESVLKRHMLYVRESLARQAQLIRASLQGESADLPELRRHLEEGLQQVLELSQECMDIAWSAQERWGGLLREQSDAVYIGTTAGARPEAAPPSPEPEPETETAGAGPARPKRKG